MVLDPLIALLLSPSVAVIDLLFSFLPAEEKKQSFFWRSEMMLRNTVNAYPDQTLP
jgi:hypothetical protein